MKRLAEIAAPDAPHDLRLVHELERDLLGIVQRLRADVVQATGEKTMDAIGLSRGIDKQNSDLRPMVRNISRFLPEFALCGVERFLSFIRRAARQLAANKFGRVAILASQEYLTTRSHGHDMNPFLLFKDIEWRNDSAIG